MIDLTKKKVTGYWGNQPIWRELTPEERLEQAKIDQETANLYIISDKLNDLRK